jgi:hypothetical protein
LAERSAAPKDSGQPRCDEAVDVVDQHPEASSPRQRHCWVHTLEAPSEPRPGLVIEWRRAATGWQARVVYALDDANHATMVETWVPAERLRPCRPANP